MPRPAAPASPTSARRPSASQALALLLTSAAYWGLAYATPRAHFGQVLGLFGVAGAAYAWLLHSRLPLRWGLGAALALRLLWLPATPALSNDFGRFRWDGLLASHGHNPFAETPRQLLRHPPPDSAALPLAELRRLLPRLNSPDYFAVYPPVAQGLYAAAAAACPRSETGFLVMVRLALLLADAGAALLLRRLLPLAGWPARRALAYLLHPLVVVEVAGNLHLEGLVVSLLLLTGALLARRRLAGAGGALALAVATKLLPLLALPLLARWLLAPRPAGRGGQRLGRLGSLGGLGRLGRFGRFGAGLAGGLGLLFLPFLLPSWLAGGGGLVPHLGASLGLYFQRFEFNASVFYLLRALGRWRLGYDPVQTLGPLLGLGTAALTLGLAWRAGRAGLPAGAAPLAGPQPAGLAALPHWLLLTLSGYFALATTVHPWYLVPLVALSCFSPLRYARVWAGLAMLSYAAYRTTPPTENALLLALEYGGVLAWAGWEGFELRVKD